MKAVLAERRGPVVVPTVAEQIDVRVGSAAERIDEVLLGSWTHRASLGVETERVERCAEPVGKCHMKIREVPHENTVRLSMPPQIAFWDAVLEWIVVPLLRRPMRTESSGRIRWAGRSTHTSEFSARRTFRLRRADVRLRC